jgi:hypothetical protein
MHPVWGAYAVVRPCFLPSATSDHFLLSFLSFLVLLTDCRNEPAVGFPLYCPPPVDSHQLVSPRSLLPYVQPPHPQQLQPRLRTCRSTPSRSEYVHGQPEQQHAQPTSSTPNSPSSSTPNSPSSSGSSRRRRSQPQRCSAAAGGCSAAVAAVSPNSSIAVRLAAEAAVPQQLAAGRRQ